MLLDSVTLKVVLQIFNRASSRFYPKFDAQNSSAPLAMILKPPYSIPSFNPMADSTIVC